MQVTVDGGAFAAATCQTVAPHRSNRRSDRFTTADPEAVFRRGLYTILCLSITWVYGSICVIIYRHFDNHFFYIPYFPALSVKYHVIRPFGEQGWFQIY